MAQHSLFIAMAEKRYNYFVQNCGLHTCCQLCGDYLELVELGPHMVNEHGVENECIWCMDYKWPPGDKAGFEHMYRCIFRHLDESSAISELLADCCY